MRALSLLALGILLIASLGCNTSGVGTPSAAEVTPALEQYLETEFGQYEDLKLTGPTDVSVGSYNQQFEGWPVYANFKAKFTRDGVPNFHNGATSASAMGGMVKAGIPVCYVLKTEDRFFCFKAGVSKTMDEMAEKMRTAISQTKTSKNGRMTRAQMIEVQRKMSASMKKMKQPTEAEIRGMVRDAMPRF